MGKRSLLFVMVFVLILNISLSSSEDFGYNLIPPTTFNNNTAFVNQTAHWVTPSLGVLSDANSTQFLNLGGTLNINESWVTSKWCKLTGCTMEGNLNMSGNNITNVDTITAIKFVGDGSGLTNVNGTAPSTDFNIFINGSAYDNVHYNITAGDADNVEVVIIPGNKFIFGDTFT